MNIADYCTSGRFMVYSSAIPCKTLKYPDIIFSLKSLYVLISSSSCPYIRLIWAAAFSDSMTVSKGTVAGPLFAKIISPIAIIAWCFTLIATVLAWRMPFKSGTKSW